MTTIEEIIQEIKPEKVTGATTGKRIKAVTPLNRLNTDQEVLMWVNEANTAALETIKAGVLICPLGSPIPGFPECTYLQVTHPRRAFQQVITHFFMEKPPIGISDSCHIHPSAAIGRGVFIGEQVVIEANCRIGDQVRIDHHTVIKKDTVIMDHVSIGANCVIGGTGFGYEKDETGNWALIPHIGNVILHEFVEIGNCTTIDRAVLGSTEIKSHTKIDNLVHIAHGVVIGSNSLVIAHAMIGGSTQIGDGVWVAPAASIINKTQVGDEAVIGMGAVVIRPVGAGETVVGNPGKIIKP